MLTILSVAVAPNEHLEGAMRMPGELPVTLAFKFDGNPAWILTKVLGELEFIESE